jgi:hypothetical protein
LTVPNLITTYYTIPPASPALPAGNYCWNVLATDALGNGPTTSAMFHFTANATTITPPAAPVLTNPAVGSSWKPTTLPDLTWTGVGNTYEIQIDRSATFSNPVRDVVQSSTSYTVSPQLEAGIYYWHVRAINAQSVAGAYSTTRTFIIQATPPIAPRLVSPAQNGSTTLLHPTLTWQAVAGAKTYIIEVASDSSFTTLIVNDKPITAPTVSYAMTTETLTYGQTYYWRVEALDAAGNTSPWSTPFQFTATVHLSPANGSSTTLVRPTFIWQAVTGATQYQLQVASDTGFGNPVATYTGTLTRFTIPATSPAFSYGTYYWQVTVITSGGPITLPYWTLTVTANAPGIPVLTGPVNNGLTNDDTPTFGWKTATNAQSYELQIATTTTFASPVVDATIPSNLLLYSSTTLTDGKYYWRVRSLNVNNATSAWSTVWNVTVDTTPPDAPILLGPANGTTTTNPTLTLRWNAVTGTTRYDVAIDTVNTTPPVVPAISLGNVTSFLVGQPLAQDTYYWQVRAIDAAGNVGAWSTVRGFTVAAGMSSQSIKPTATPQPTEATPEPTVVPTFAPPTNTPAAPTPTTIPLVTVEAESASVTHVGIWTAQATNNASGGQYLYSSGQADDSLSLAFSGAHLDIVYVRHPDLGSFAIEIDGVLRQTISETGEQTFRQHVNLDNLGSGSHTLRVYVVSGTVALDAFRLEAVTAIPATLMPTPSATPTSSRTIPVTSTNEPTSEPSPTPTAAAPASTPVAASPTPIQLVAVEAESEVVTRSGNWTIRSSSSASGQHYLLSSGQAGDALTLGFRGTQVTVTYLKHPSFGSFAVNVDGVLLQTVVTSVGEASFDAQVTLKNLASGAHTLQVFAVQGIIALDVFKVEDVAALSATQIPTLSPTATSQPTEQDTALPNPTPTLLPTDTPTLSPIATLAPTETLTPTATSTHTPSPASPTEAPQVTGTVLIP